MSFCKACGGNIEWHLTKSGANMPINPEPVVGGRYVFNRSLRLEYVGSGSAEAGQKRYDSHQQTCPKKGQAPRRAPDVSEERSGCCFRCGSDDHWLAECPEEP